MNSTTRIHACHITRVTPPRFGQQRGSTVIAVKGRRQSFRPVVLRLMRAMTGDTGLPHANGCPSPETATPTPAGSSTRNRECGQRLPQPDSGQGLEALICGVITKLPKNEIETDLQRAYADTLKSPSHKDL